MIRGGGRASPLAFHPAPVRSCRYTCARVLDQTKCVCNTGMLKGGGRRLWPTGWLAGWLKQLQTPAFRPQTGSRPPSPAHRPNHSKERGGSGKHLGQTSPSSPLFLGLFPFPSTASDPPLFMELPIRQPHREQTQPGAAPYLSIRLSTRTPSGTTHLTDQTTQTRTRAGLPSGQSTQHSRRLTHRQGCPACLSALPATPPCA